MNGVPVSAVNDSNGWAIETLKNPKFPLELLLRVIALSVETLKLVGGAAQARRA